MLRSLAHSPWTQLVVGLVFLGTPLLSTTVRNQNGSGQALVWFGAGLFGLGLLVVIRPYVLARRKNSNTGPVPDPQVIPLLGPQGLNIREAFLSFYQYFNILIAPARRTERAIAAATIIIGAVLYMFGPMLIRWLGPISG